MKFAIVSALGLVSALAQTPAPAPASPAPSPDFFENKVRPVLAENCYDCHTSAEMGGLRVDSRERLLQGGKSGPAVMPGDPDKSLLIQAVRQSGDLKMPKGGKLKPAEVQALADWVKAGAPWPETKVTAAPSSPNKVITPEQRAFWSFRPVSNPAPPPNADAAAAPAPAADQAVPAAVPAATPAAPSTTLPQPSTPK